MTPASFESLGEGDRTDLRIELESTSQAPALARAALNGFCETCAVPADAAATVLLLVSELVTNAVIHPDSELQEMITVDARVRNDTVRVEVADAGPRFTPRPRNPDRAHGGYGLYLVDQQAESWGMGTGPTTTVWFEVAGAAA